MVKLKILVVEVDEDILDLLIYNFSGAGFEVITAKDGKSALRAVKQYHPAIIVLDLMLPEVDGLEVCKELKRTPETSKIPVVMLTAKGEEVDRIVGLELGADDYVVKPFSPRELILRVRAVLRRFPMNTASEKVWAKEGLQMDLDAHKLTIDGQDVALTALEFRLLWELVRYPGRVHTRDQLLEKVWAYQFEGYARTVDTHVRRLRQKLGAYSEWVETVRGVGYRFRQ